MSRELGYTFTLGASLNSSFRGSMSAARSEITGLAQSVNRLESSGVAKLGAGFEAQRQKVAGLGRDLRSAQAELTGLRERANAAGGASGTLARQIAQAERQVQGLSRSLRSSSESYREQIARIRTTEGSISSLRRNYQGLASDIDRARQHQEGLSANLARRDALSGQRQNLQGQIMGTVAMGATVAAPAALAIGFEDSMAKVGALSNATREDLALLTDQARQLGRDTVFTASQAAEGMGYLAMAGFDTTQTMATMPSMLNLAAAGNTDLGRTADIASNILSGFKLKAEQMGMASDALAKTFTSSNTTLESLGETMKYVGPVAASVGMSMQQTAAATGLLGNVGIQGSQAGTALRAALLRLAAPPKMAREALAELTGASGPELDELAEHMEGAAAASQTLTQMGVATKDAAGNLRPLADILEDLNAKTAEMGTGDKAEVFKNVFGTEASAAMIALADQAGKTIDDAGNRITDSLGRPTTALRKYTEEIEKSGGTSARISKMMNDTTGGALRQMGSAFEDVGISVGNLFLPVIRSTANGLSGLAKNVSWFVQKFPQFSSAVAYAGAGVVALAVGSLALGYASNVIGTGLNTAQRAMLLLSGAQLTTAGTTQTLTIWQRAHNLATLSWRDVMAGGVSRVRGLATALSTFTGIQRGATLGTVLYTTASNICGVATKVLKFGVRGLGTAFKFALGPVGLIITALTIGAGLIIDNWDTVGPYFKGMWDGIVGVFQGAWDIISGIIDMVGKGMSWIGEQIDSVPVLGSAKRGLGQAWDWATGNDKEETPKPAAQTVADTVAPTVAATAPPVQKNPEQGTAKNVLGEAWDWAFGNDEKDEKTPKPAAQTVAPTVAATAPPVPQAEPVSQSVPPTLAATVPASSPPIQNAMAPAETPPMAAAPNVPKREGRSKGVSAEEKRMLDEASAYGATGAATGASPTTITVPMTFNVQGLDATTFKQRIEDYRKDFESIVRRVVDDMERGKTRTTYVPSG